MQCFGDFCNIIIYVYSSFFSYCYGTEISTSSSGNCWGFLPAFRLHYEHRCHILLNHGEEGDLEMPVTFCKDGNCEVKVDDGNGTLMTVRMELNKFESSSFTATINGVINYFSAAFYMKDSVEYVSVWSDDKHHEFLIIKPVLDKNVELSSFQLSDRKWASMHPLGVHAPMAGRLVRVLVQNGVKVNKGDPLVILEAMKMEHIVRAPRDGFVKGLALDGVQNVKDNSMLLIVDDGQES
ncbi:hypothetical protein KP509_1Z290600 [Ceratopteris richardii]|nr:hypothetical protein KP509_1Z290600 [Ceratopteris richardii]